MKKSMKIALTVLIIICVLLIAGAGAYRYGIDRQKKAAISEFNKSFAAVKNGEVVKFFGKENKSFKENPILAGMLKNVKYNIKSVDADFKNCDIVVDITNKNFQKIFSNVLTKYLSFSLSTAFSGEKLSHEEMNAKLKKILEEEMASKEVEEITTSVVFKYSKVGKELKLTVDEETLTNALFPGYLDIKANMENKENEKETNLPKEVEVNEMIKDLAK